MEVGGRVTMTVVHGRVVARDGRPTGSPSGARFIHRIGARAGALA
jgi:N-acyl-D-aspartate/D-glutamate deacylase